MADNVNVDAGTGIEVATDQVPITTGPHYQRVKPQIGPDGTVGDWSAANPGPIAGNVVHDLADAGAPVKIGGKAHDADDALVADADRVDAWFDRLGRLVMVNAHPVTTIGRFVQTATGPTSLISAPGANLSIVVLSLLASNLSAVKTRLDLKEATTDKVSLVCTADGGGGTHTFGSGWTLPANTALQAGLSTGVTSIYIVLEYYVAGTQTA